MATCQKGQARATEKEHFVYRVISKVPIVV